MSRGFNNSMQMYEIKMKKTNLTTGPVVVFSFFCAFLVLGISGEMIIDEARSVYVVYMGSDSSATMDSLEEQHFQLLASAVKSDHDPDKPLMLRRYTYGFSGFTALLTEEEALAIGRNVGVVSVFPDQMLDLHTTRSWDFLDTLGSNFDPVIVPVTSTSSISPVGMQDAIVGFLDTGIWPESKSFDDENIGEIPARWKGKCENGEDFNASNCNRKLIGARSYTSSVSAYEKPSSPRDTSGHGTHTASTAAGSLVANASYYGLARGTAQGGSPTARIAAYKVCGAGGCSGSAILAAFDDAIADGVDILSLSLGASPFLRPDFAQDPIAIGAFHAVANGITVVCSAGNDGPQAGTVVNDAPWILTVAASTIDRDFISDVVLGDNTVIKGETINFSKLNKSAVYPLVYGGSAANSDINESLAGSCDPGSLNRDKVDGRIVFCKNTDNVGLTRREKAEGLENLGAKGMVLAEDPLGPAMTYLSLPVSIVSLHDGDEIISYINTTKDPVATILPTKTILGLRPAPVVADFSSRGPSIMTRNILKPDIAAPGVDILAAWPPLNDSTVVPPGEPPTPFNVISGTSMACPHVTGVAASVKSAHPDWTPSAIRSAIMTTAATMLIDDNSGSRVIGYAHGSGEVDPLGAHRPGLVYELEPEDYLQFLCNYGYNETTIRLISPMSFKCAVNSSTEMISQLNYPSIAVSVSSGGGNNNDNRTITRRVTNIGEEEETTYTATVLVKSPDRGLVVSIVPDELKFTAKDKKLSYQVTFSGFAAAAAKEDLFGAITWSNGKYNVTSMFVVGIQH